MELSTGDGAKVTFVATDEPATSAGARIGGELDISNVELLRPFLEKLVDQRPDLLVLDLADLSFFDSSGIALLVEISEKVASLELRNPSELIRRIVEGTGLRDVLRFES